jgi:WD40 repeat protein
LACATVRPQQLPNPSTPARPAPRAWSGRVDKWVLDWILSRSPLDRLDPARIPAEQRIDSLSRELVAVLGYAPGRHRGPVTGVAYSPDGKWVASCGGEEVFLWDATSIRVAAVLKSASGVNALAFTPDGKRLAAWGGTCVQFWDLGADAIVPGGQLDWKDPVVRGLGFSPQHNKAALGMANRQRDLLNLSNENTDYWVQLWDLSGGTPTAQPPVWGKNLPGQIPSTLVMSPDGRTLAAVIRSEDVPRFGTGSHVQILNPHAQEHEAAPPPPPQEHEAAPPPLHKRIIIIVILVGSAIALVASIGVGIRLYRRPIPGQPDGHKVAAGCAAVSLVLGLVMALLLKAGRSDDDLMRFVTEKGETKASDKASLLRIVGGGGVVAFSPDGRMFAMGGHDHQVLLYDVNADPIKPKAVLEGCTQAVQALAFAPDGRWLAGGDREGTVCLWDLQGDQPRQRAVFRGQNTAAVSAIAFSPDGQTLATGGGDCTVRFWDLGDKTPLEKTIDSGPAMFIRSMASSADGRTLALGCLDKTVRFWALDSPVPWERLVIKGLADVAEQLALSPDNKSLALRDAKNAVRLWDLSGPVPTEWAMPSQITDNANQKKNRAPTIEDSGWFLGLDTHNNREKKKRNRFANPLEDQLLFSPDNKFLVSVSRILGPDVVDASGVTRTFGKQLRLWSLSGPAPRPLDHESLPSNTETVRFSPDSRTLAVKEMGVFGLAGEIELWDLSDNQLRKGGTLAGHKEPGLLFSDSETLPALRLSDEDGRQSAVNTDGRHVAVLNGNGTVFIRRFGDPGEPDRSLTWCNQTLTHEPNHAQALLQRGRLYLEQCRDEIAKPRPDGGPPRAALTHEQALADLTAVIRLDPKSATAHLFRGTCYLWNKQPEAAQKDFGEAIGLDPGCASAYYLRGLIQAFRKEWASAIADFTEVIRLDPGNAQAYYQRGLARAYQEDYPQARQDLERALALDPALENASPNGP